MLRDEFNRLMALFQEASEGKPIHLEEVFKQSLQFFAQMKEQIATGTQEDKVEAMKLMTEMYTQMMMASKRISEMSGMTEEQLTAFAENPANFTAEQWKAIQTSREQIARAGEDVAKTLEKGGSMGKEAEKSENKKPKDKKGKKSQWMRS